jgi:hypothetical protein
VDPEVEDLPDWTGEVPALPLDAGTARDGADDDARATPDAGGADDFDAGSGEVFWPRLVARTNDFLELADATADSDGRVWLVGNAGGAVTFLAEDGGEALEPFEPDHVWAMCLTPTGRSCGRASFGGGDGGFLAVRDVQTDAAGRMVVAGSFSGSPVLAERALDPGPSGTASFLLRWDPVDDPSGQDAEVGVIRGSALVGVLAIAPLASGGVAVACNVAEDGALTVEGWSGTASPSRDVAGGVTVLRLDDALGIVTLQDGSPSAASGMAVARGDEATFAWKSASGGSVSVGHLAGLGFTADTFMAECSKLAGTATESGGLALACSASGDGPAAPAPAGDLWITTWPTLDATAEVEGEAVFGGTGEETIARGCAGAGGGAVWVGTFFAPSNIDGAVPPSAGGADVLVFSTDEGASPSADVLASFGSTGFDTATTCAPDGDGGLVIAGTAGGVMDVDGVSVGAPAEQGVLSVQLWAHRLPPP